MSPVTRERPGVANARPDALDLFVVCFFYIGGLIFLWDAPAWAPNVYIGHDQFGDADFWWQGILEMSQGVFWDNVNFTFRMGYAIFGGLLVTLFGPNYAVFHKFLIALFLAIASAFYIVGIPRIGRTMAFALAATLVFASPLVAVWLAISTSDGLGLIFNLVALIALWIALSGRARYGALATGGIFIALAALTRPLMTIFAAPAALLIFLFAKGLFRARVVPVIVFVVAVALPTLPWSALFYLKTGNIGLAGYDASIFYAASDPNIQVWDPPMYLPIEQAAKERLGVPSVTARQVDDEFRRQAAANYVKYFGYHLRRLPGHILALAGFSYETLNPTNPWGILTRLLICGLLMLGLLVSCWAERRWFGAAAALAIFGLAFWPTGAALIVIATALLFALPVSWRGIGPLERLTAFYWWSGVVALFLTGGTWGPPLAPHIDINALGYRLGGQFLFANDWLILMAMAAAAGRPWVPDAWLACWVDRNRWLARIDGARAFRLAVSVGLAGLALLYVSGLSVFGARAWQRSHTVPVHMPPVAPLVSALCANAGGLLPISIEAQPASVLYQMSEPEPTKRLEGLRVVTGAIGGLIWQMAGQDRTRALFYQQDISSPFEFNRNRSDVEFDGLLPESLWRNRAGAWLVRSFREVGPHVGYLYYETLPKVQMFVPLAADRRSFDFAGAVRFRLARYASILSYSGDLHPANASLGWQKYPSADTNRRWFILEPVGPSRNSGEISIDINLSDAIGRRMVGFSFRVEPVPGNPLGQDQISVAVQSADAVGRTRDIIRRATSAHGDAVDGRIDGLAAAIPDDASHVRISFHGVGAEEMVRVIELKIVSDDVRPGIAGSLCAPP